LAQVSSLPRTRQFYPRRLVARAPALLHTDRVFPTLFHIGGYTLHTFAVMVLIAYLVGSGYIRRDAERRKLDPDLIARLCGYALAAVIIGGRLGYLLFERRDLLFSLEAVKIWHGGLVLYGGLLSVFAVVVGFALAYKLPLLTVCDLFAVGGMLGLAIGRWGCFFAGDDYGKPAPGLPWAVRFTNPDCLVPYELRGVPLHPTQIYLSLNAFVIFLILRALAKRGPAPGVVTAALLMLYAVGRSFIEFFRGDADRGFVGPMSWAQFISIFVFAGGVALLLAVRARPAKTTSPA
jgi:phosphatidylglycerol:prolipoprotein diacylglycerol transferase